MTANSVYLTQPDLTAGEVAEATEGRYAPLGKVWLCMMCGKTAKDYCTEKGGWDESCALNCILVDEAAKLPTAEQVSEFVLARANRISGLQASIASLMSSVKDGSYETDPDLLKLAQEAISRRDQKAGA